SRAAHHRLRARGRSAAAQGAGRTGAEGRARRGRLRAVGRVDAADRAPQECLRHPEIHRAAVLERVDRLIAGGTMLAEILRRLVATIPVMVVVALAVFALLHVTPGDPAVIIAGDYATTDDIARIRTRLGLDQPFTTQVGLWLGRVVRGDLGTSIFSGLPVSTLLRPPAAATAVAH